MIELHQAPSKAEALLDVMGKLGFAFGRIDRRKIGFQLSDVVHEICHQELSCQACDGDDIGIGESSSPYLGQVAIAPGDFPDFAVGV